MLKRIMFVVALLLFNAPAGLSQMEQAQPLYTYVSQFQVPRADWAQFAQDSEKATNPIFERLLTDGTIIGWGNFENIVHTPEGMTHGSWWSATSLAGITHVLDELRKVGPRPGQIAATKHEDLLMRTVMYRASSVSGATGYLRVVCTVAQPGKGDDYVATVKKYLGPTFEEQFKKGVATYYGFDEQYVNTQVPSLRCLVITYPNAEAMNTWATAIATAFDKMSPDERKGWEDAQASTTVPNSRRDLMARITHYTHK